MIECYMRLILNSHIQERQIKENGLRILRTIDEIHSDLSMLKNSGVDRVILAVNAEKDYDVNETIEFVKELRKFCQ
jgi:hypothetical protein